MSITVEELFYNRSEIINSDGDYTTADIPYLVFNATNENEAILAVDAQSPATYQDIPKDTIEITKRFRDDAFKVLVKYKTNAKSGGGGELPEPVYTFDTTGGTIHVTQSLETRSSTPAAGETAVDYQKGIKWNGEVFEGTDIPAPKFVFSEIHYFRPARCSWAFRENLAKMTGKINATAFRTFEPEQVLFWGATGRRQGNKSSDLWEVEYKFEAGENKVNQDIGNSIIVAEIKAWDFFWVEYQPTINTTPKKLVKIPRCAYVERVLEKANFYLLGI